MNVTFKNKIDKNAFISNNWNILENAIKENIEHFEDKYRKSLRNTFITMICSMVFVFGIIWVLRDKIALDVVFVILGGWLCFFVVGFLCDIIEFPYYLQKMRLGKMEAQKFFEIDASSATIKDLVSLFKRDTVFYYDDYKKVKDLFKDLYLFEKIQEFQIIKFKKDNDYIRSLEYADEDGIVEKVNVYIKTKKSVNLSEDNYILQMTEDGLRFIIPKE